MSVTSFYPVLLTQDVPAAAAFYQEVLDFEVTFEADWYVSLRLGVFELALLAYDHATIPEGHQVLPRGMILNLEVDDVDAIYDRLTSIGGTRLMQAMRDEDFGQRHFILAAPDGVMLDVIQPIQPSGEYAEAYVES